MTVTGNRQELERDGTEAVENSSNLIGQMVEGSLEALDDWWETGQ